LVIFAEHAVVQDSPPSAYLPTHNVKTDKFLVLGDIGRAQGGIEALRQRMRVDPGRKDSTHGSRTAASDCKLSTRRRTIYCCASISVPAAKTTFVDISKRDKVLTVEGNALFRLLGVAGLQRVPTFSHIRTGGLDPRI